MGNGEKGNWRDRFVAWLFGRKVKPPQRVIAYKLREDKRDAYYEPIYGDGVPPDANLQRSLLSELVDAELEKAAKEYAEILAKKAKLVLPRQK